MEKSLVIIGAGGHSRVVVDTATALGLSIHGIIDINYAGQEEKIIGAPIIGGPDVISSLQLDAHVFAFGIGDNMTRKEHMESLVKLNCEIITLVHPSAIVSKSEVEIGVGSFINAGSIINACAKLGKGTIINSGAIVEHECVLGDFVHIAPNASIAGRVKIGANSFIGMGSCVIPETEIGSGVVVGANATITKNLASNSKVVGINRQLSND
jgi:sugar O-acyltransferase (sialic acid O-acetyltransferase NeuD family)